MFGWFRSKAVCPIKPEKREWIDQRWSWLEQQFGRDRLLQTRLILPQPEFFPEPYRQRSADLKPMFERVCGYMNVPPETVQLSVYQEDWANPKQGHIHHFHGNGTAGLYQEADDCFHIAIEVSNLDDPLSIVAAMAHELAHVHLLGHRRLSHNEPDHEQLTDLLTVFLGLGIFTANSVVRETNWTIGRHSGWSVRRLGYMTMPEFGYALARFALARNEPKPLWMRELRLDVRSAFQQSLRFLTEEPLSESVACP